VCFESQGDFFQEGNKEIREQGNREIKEKSIYASHLAAGLDRRVF
jgi:hypothetical protein